MQARIHAAKCVGNNDDANKMQAQLDQLNASKNLKDTKAVLESSKMPEMNKAVKLTSEAAKKEFVESLGYLIGGVAQEKILLDKVLQNVKSLQKEVASNRLAVLLESLNSLQAWRTQWEPTLRMLLLPLMHTLFTPRKTELAWKM